MDEIIIVDTGSKDKTKEIASRYTDLVFDFVWKDDFSLARNEAFAHANKPFLMWLDADDVMEPEDVEKLMALKETLSENVDAVMMPYHCGIRGDGTPSLVFERERIIRRDSGLRFSGFVHEAIALHGNVIHADIPVNHQGGNKKKNKRRNLMIYEKHISRGNTMTPRDQYYYARELMDCGETERAEQTFSRFLAMDGCWLPNRVDAHVQRGHCLKKLGRKLEARVEYLVAMAYGAPGAEALCAMGDAWLEDGNVRAAVPWYQMALHVKPNAADGGFVRPMMHTYVPAMQLCVCYDHLGMKTEAMEMNELALTYCPDDPAAIRNRDYFSGSE
jgi:glycosyltransferase involved in cell wall biosynthesis